MIKVYWGAPGLKEDYTRLWQTCIVKPEAKPYVDAAVHTMLANKSKYEAIAKLAGGTIPWWVIACIHKMECGLDFRKHLHNGDSLAARTKRVPVGRPVGTPPFTFEGSAVDALRLKKFHLVTDWSVEHVLYLFEGFNGYGYRQYREPVKSPYLWSFTNQYTKGKYVADGKWDKETVSKQLGIVPIMKALGVK